MSANTDSDMPKVAFTSVVGTIFMYSIPIACEADGAAAVLLMAEDALGTFKGPKIAVADGMSVGGDPSSPSLVPIRAAQVLLEKMGVDTADLEAIELMEAYAVQAMTARDQLKLPEDCLNQLGGALARGHPIGASGAILAVHLFDLLSAQESPTAAPIGMGLAMIAAAGGLGSAMVLQRLGWKGG